MCDFSATKGGAMMHAVVLNTPAGTSLDEEARNRAFVLDRGPKDSGGTRIVGNDHLRLSLRNGSGATIHGIGFGLGEFERMVKSETIDMCYCLEESEWNGERKLDLVVKDIKPHAVAVNA